VVGCALQCWDKYLEKVDSVSLLLFELIRAEPTLASLQVRPDSNRTIFNTEMNFAGIAEYYNEKVRSDKKIRTAEQVLGVITGLVDREGVYGIQAGVVPNDEEIERPANIHAQMGFSRLLYTDGMHNVT